MFQINNNPLDTGFSEVITSVRPKAVTSMINNYKDKVKIAVSVFIFVRVFFFYSSQLVQIDVWQAARGGFVASRQNAQPSH